MITTTDPAVVVISPTTATNFTEAIPTEAEFAAELLDDAESARRNVAALAEILAGCPPEYKISAFLFRGLLETALCHLENTVDGVRLLAAFPQGNAA